MKDIAAPKVEETVARVRAAFTPQGVLVDALHAWIDHGHAASLATDNEVGMQLAVQWSHAVHQATRHGARGTMRAWFAAHQGRPIDTLQVHQDGGVWSADPRVVGEVHPTYVEIAGSRRYYGATRIVTQTPTTLIICTPSAICAYRESETEE